MTFEKRKKKSADVYIKKSIDQHWTSSKNKNIINLFGEFDSNLLFTTIP